MQRIALVASCALALLLTLAPVASGYCTTRGAADVRAVTGDPADVRDTTTTLLGIVDGCEPSGVSYRFEYGTTNDLGSVTPSRTVDPVDGPQVVAADLTGLQPGTTYHYRLVVIAPDDVEVAGRDRTLTTTVGRPDQGATGPAGPTGPTGPAGPAGPQGGPGPQGLTAPMAPLAEPLGPGAPAPVFASMTYGGVEFGVSSVRFRVEQQIDDVGRVGAKGERISRLLPGPRVTTLEIDRPVDQDTAKLLNRLQSEDLRADRDAALRFVDLEGRTVLEITLGQGLIASHAVSIDATTGAASEQVGFRFEDATVRKGRAAASITALRRATSKVLGRAARFRPADSLVRPLRRIRLDQAGTTISDAVTTLGWELEREIVELADTRGAAAKRLVPGQLQVRASLSAPLGSEGQVLLRALERTDDRPPPDATLTLLDDANGRAATLGLSGVLLERYELGDAGALLTEMAGLRAGGLEYSAR